MQRERLLHGLLLTFGSSISTAMECLLMVGWVRSPTAGSEHPSLQNLGLGDWLLSGNCYGRFGSRRDRRTFGFIAGKRSVKFRFPEADIHHRVLTTQTRLSSFSEAVRRSATTLSCFASTKLPFVRSGSGQYRTAR